MTKHNKVIIVGSGLAGLSAAVYLAKENIPCVVLESNPYLGGRTASWDEDGMMVESGLHRFLGFYEALPKVLQEVGVGVDEIVEWVNEIEIRLPESGPSGIFTLSPLGEPVDTLLSLLGNNNYLSPSEKLSLSKFIASGLRQYFAQPRELDEVSIFDFATKEGLDEKLITKIVTPLSTGLFFLSPRHYSSYVFFGTIGPYLSRMHQLKVGAFRGGMSEVMIDPLVEYITHHGGSVKTNEEVSGLAVSGENVAGVLVKDELVKADEVILAASLAGAQAIIERTQAVSPVFSKLLSLPSMPVVTIQFELREPSISTDRVVFSPNTLWASYAEQSRTTFSQLPGRLSAIMADAEELLPLSDKEVFQRARVDAEKINIDLSTVKNYRVIRHAADFYSLSPGSEKLRPPQATRISGLTLAGDYTQQKYLATMEGAVVSGKIAAEIVLEKLR